MRTRALIFDLDGTLADSIEAHRESYRLVLERHGLPLDTDFIVRRFGMVSSEIWAEFARHYNVVLDPEALAREKYALFSRTASRIRVLPGVLPLLAHAESMGWKKGIATGASRDNMEFILDATGLAGRFDALLPGDEAPCGKGEPDIWLMAAGMVDAPPEACWVFEDGMPGLLSAKRAGMRTVAVASGATPLSELAAAAPDAMVERLDMLDMAILDS